MLAGAYLGAVGVATEVFHSLIQGPIGYTAETRDLGPETSVAGVLADPGELGGRESPPFVRMNLEVAALHPQGTRTSLGW